MIPTLPPILSRLRNALALLLICGGAAGIVAGALSPWATFRVLHNIEINLPGIVFSWGGLCLSVAVLVLLGARRWPVLCVAGALLTLHWAAEGQRRVPERVKFQLAGSQLVLASSVNRLLDQFHIPDIEVANLGTPNAELLGVGLGWTVKGAYVLLLGGLIGLPGDPALVWVYTRTARVRCRSCGTRRMLSRAAQFCPHCGVSALPTGVHVCPHCGVRAKRGDKHCIACGSGLPGSA